MKKIIPMLSTLLNDLALFLSRPFLMWEYTPQRKILLALFVGITPAAFVHIYQPFGFKRNLLSLTCSHASVDIIVLLVFYFIVPLGFNGYFKNKSRTIGREAIWVLGVILFATVGHKLVIDFFSIPNVSLFLTFKYLLALGVIPFLIWSSLSIYQMTIESPANQLIEISATVGNDKIKVFLKDLLYIKSLSNYSEVYFIDNGELRMRMLRIPLSTLGSQLNSEYCVRCHRSYIVNLFNLIKIEGNVSGGKIFLRDHDLAIPVSKSRREEVMNKLDTLPISHIS